MSGNYVHDQKNMYTYIYVRVIIYNIVGERKVIWFFVLC